MATEESPTKGKTTKDPPHRQENEIMPFNDIEQQRIRKIVGGFCGERIPDDLRNQIKVFFEVRGFGVRIMESRPFFVNNHEWMDHAVDKLKYDPYTLKWELYWMRATGKWQKYHEFRPTNRLQSVVDEITEDRFQVFWGQTQFRIYFN